MNAPRLGSAFAAWTMVYSSVHCSMQYIRQNEAPGLNSLVASAAASGFVRMRRGVGPATRLALVSGVFTTLLEFVEARPVEDGEIVRPDTRGDGI
ncbi:hypothetical protein QJS10_CPB12g01163 [Acorus calamus]|uniref:Uncharacterized protein n=1 Tax=Acorus calamus TaxID=4465 RepID=A0AAV9DKJ5_ACOCL|nr:hypothetical protein QJS10_CPB12g01163 [Acorus calamus]